MTWYSTLICADLQLSANPRDAYRFEFMDWLAKTVRNMSIDNVVLLGDVTEDKDNHSAAFANRVVRAICNLIGNEDGTVYIVQGNHDAVIQSEPFFGFLDLIPNIYWIGQPLHLHYLDAVLLPFTNDHKRDWKNLPKTKYWLTHNTFAGADIGARKLDGIPLSVIPKGVKVISGDIHVPQTFGPVTYVGAPYTVDYGDNYQGRVLLFDAITGKTQSILVPCRQKRLVEISNVAELSKAKINKGDLVKVRMHMTPDNSDKWLTYRTQVSEWAGKQGVDLFFEPIVNMGRIKKLLSEETGPMTDHDLMERYGRAREISDRLMKTGYFLMDKASK